MHKWQLRRITTFLRFIQSNRESNREVKLEKPFCGASVVLLFICLEIHWRRQHLSTNMTYLYVVMTDRFISFVIARLSLWSSYKKFVLLSSAADFDLCCRKGTLLLSLKNQGQISFVGAIGSMSMGQRICVNSHSNHQKLYSLFLLLIFIQHLHGSAGAIVNWSENG